MHTQAAALSVISAAAYLAVSRSNLYRLMRDGSLPFCKVGHRTIIRRVDADEFLERSRANYRPTSIPRDVFA